MKTIKPVLYSSLMAAGLSLAAVTALAQSGGSGSSSGSSSSSNSSNSGSTNSTAPGQSSSRPGQSQKNNDGSMSQHSDSINPTNTPRTMPDSPNSNNDLNARSGLFNTMDSDGDGRISRSEFDARRPRTSQGDTATDDRTNSNKPEKKSWWSKDKDRNDPARNTDSTTMTPQSNFSQLDTNNDGYLSSSELALAHDMGNR